MIFRRTRPMVENMRHSDGSIAESPLVVVTPDRVHEVLSRHVLTAGGFPLVLDTRASHGSWLVDARDGERVPRPVQRSSPPRRWA